ncbi:hypothetical protein [Roseimaritima ulvae]|nr:hypothetical protein [Roseimaritima ulvae]
MERLIQRPPQAQASGRPSIEVDAIGSPPPANTLTFSLALADACG